jgi:hypothetical protein
MRPVDFLAVVCKIAHETKRQKTRTFILSTKQETLPIFLSEILMAIFSIDLRIVFDSTPDRNQND